MVIYTLRPLYSGFEHKRVYMDHMCLNGEDRPVTSRHVYSVDAQRIILR
jgi:hypothetical protein